MLVLLATSCIQLGARRSGFVEEKLLPPPPPALWSHSRGEVCCPREGLQAHRKSCAVFTGSTSPSSVQTKHTSHQLAPEEQEEVTASASSCWIEIKGERGSRDSYCPWAEPTPGITEEFTASLFHLVVVKDLYLNPTWMHVYSSSLVWR